MRRASMQRAWPVPPGVPGRLGDDGNPHHHGRIVEADVPDRDRLGLALRGLERRTVGLGGAVDFPRMLGRGELPQTGEIMTRSELDRTERRDDGESG